MSKATLFSGNLPFGHCQYFHGRTQIKRASTFGNGPEDPLSQVHLVSSGEAVYLCKLRGTTSGPNRIIDGTDRILRWSPAVKLVAATSEGALLFVQSLVKHNEVSPTFTFSPAHNWQNWARLLPVEELRNLRGNFVATISKLPIVTLSVVFRRRPIVSQKQHDILQPLQLSSLKRKMAGLYILHCNSVITTEISITLADVSYHMYVESICCSQVSKVSPWAIVFTPGPIKNQKQKLIIDVRKVSLWCVSVDTEYSNNHFGSSKRYF